MAFELDQDRIAKSLGVIAAPAETSQPVHEQVTTISAVADTASRPARNWNISSRKAVALAAGAFVVAAAGAFVGANNSGEMQAQTTEPKAEAPLIIPENPLPTYESNSTTSTDLSLLPPDTTKPKAKSFTIGSISLGTKGKDCKPDVTGYVQAASIPLVFNGNRKLVETQKIKFSYYSCGTKIGAFVEDMGDSTQEPITDILRVRVNRDDIDFSFSTDKIMPKVTNILPAQNLQEKGYEGQSDVCIAFEETPGCKNAKVAKNLLLTKAQEKFISNSMAIMVLKSIKATCSARAEGIFKQKIAKLHDNQAQGQQVDGSYVSELYTDSASNIVSDEHDFTQEAISSFSSLSGSNDPNKLRSIFGNNVPLTVVCTVNPINVSEG